MNDNIMIHLPLLFYCSLCVCLFWLERDLFRISILIVCDGLATATATGCKDTLR